MTDEVVVIGAGVAGLSAATLLAEQGFRVRVLEARPSGGGRCSAFTDPATGERVDNGQHVLIGCYHETFRFLRRIDAADRVRLQPHLAVGVIDRGGRASRLVCPPWPAPIHLAAGIIRWDALVWRERLAPLRLLPRLRPGAPPAPACTVREWLERNGQPERLIELLWEPLAVAALNQPIDAASAEPFRQVLQRMFTTDRRDSALGLPLVPLDALFVQPSLALLHRHGSGMETSSRAKVEAGAASAPVVRVRDTALRPAAVVCAVAWHALPDVLPGIPELEEVIAAARDTDASPIVSVNFWLDRPVVSEEFVGLPGRDMQWLFDKQRLFGEGSTHVTMVSSGAARLVARSNDEIVEIALRELRQAIEASRAVTVTRAVVVREKRATFSLAPGQPVRPPTTTSVPGLFLAGDWIDTGLPATIESAVVSGHWAAEAVARFLRPSALTP